MTNTLYFDCFSGISGDMTLAALLDLGYAEKTLNRHINALKLGPFKLEKALVVRQGLQGLHIAPHWSQPNPHHRSYRDIVHLIARASLPAGIKKNVLAVFKLLGQVEAECHHLPLARIHFHELGALDTIFDIVGVCSALHELAIDDILVSPINVGAGLIKSAHGTLPVPAPAVSALLQHYPIYAKGPQAELTTPTGAALVRHFAKPASLLPLGVLKAQGYGAGTKTFKSHPNLLRAFWLHRPASHAQQDTIIMLKTNIDDQTPEVVAYVQDLLMKNKALDTAVVPIQMKKNRLGMQLEVMCTRDQAESLAKLILQETSTLGVRLEECPRLILKRIIKTVTVQGQSIRIKEAYWGDRLVKTKPEAEDVQKAARHLQLPIQDVLTLLIKTHGAAFRRTKVRPG